MKILAINASPRPNGNTSQLLQELVNQAKSKGAETKTYDLNKLKIKGCQGCYDCKKEGKCSVNDDMIPILNDIFKYDVIILASPIYMWQMTAQAKLFTDRLLPVIGPDFTTRLNGQKLLTIFTQGSESADTFRPYIESTNKMFQFLGFQTLQPIIATGLYDVDDIQNHKEFIDQAKYAADGIMMSECM